jgi:hypothetical protein
MNYEQYAEYMKKERSRTKEMDLTSDLDRALMLIEISRQSKNPVEDLQLAIACIAREVVRLESRA